MTPPYRIWAVSPWNDSRHHNAPPPLRLGKFELDIHRFASIFIVAWTGADAAEREGEAVPAFDDQVEIRRPWGDWIFLRQVRDQQGGGGFVIHNPWGNTTQPQGAADRNRLEVGYRASTGATTWGQVVIQGPTGNVGLGMVNPRARLHVNGNLIVTGDIALQNADVAEEFAVQQAEGVQAGEVMVLGDEEGSVLRSTEEYDARVAGVVSGAGQLRPGIVLDRRETGKPRVSVAMVGKVFCRVDAESGGPVRVGDLLTTSSTPGHAMRAADRHRSFGATLGKALRALPAGCGLIPVLVALQ